MRCSNLPIHCKYIPSDTVNSRRLYFMQLESIYEELSPFYMLIYLHDLKPFTPPNLKSLLHRLKSGLLLDETQQKIHAALIEISNTNKNNKLKKKKDRLIAYSKQEITLGKIEKASLSTNINISRDQSTKYTNQSGSFIDESCIIDHDPHHKGDKDVYEYTDKQEGKIYDGKLYIQLEVTYRGKSATIPVDFIVSPQIKQSTVNNFVRMKINSKAGNNLQIFINKRKILVEVKEGENIIGLDYLREHRIILQSNYLPEVSRFSMKYTN